MSGSDLRKPRYENNIPNPEETPKTNAAKKLADALKSFDFENVEWKFKIY